MKPHRGDKHPESGLFYWGTVVKNGKTYLRWVSADTLEANRKNQNRLVKKWQKDNPEKHRKNTAKFCQIHSRRRNQEARVYRREWKKRRFKSDPLYRLKVLVSSRLRIALKRSGHLKTQKAVESLGCSLSFLRAYLGTRFKPGMDWSNAGTVWHIDHVIPLASATTKKQILGLCHYTNLQPLWKRDNIIKGDKRQTQIELFPSTTNQIK